MANSPLSICLNLIIFWLFIVQFSIDIKATNNQLTHLDSLNLELKNAEHDTLRAKLYVALSEELYRSNPDTIIPLCKMALQLIEGLPENELTIKHVREIQSKALNNIGYIYNRRGEVTKSLDYYTKSLALKQEIDDKRGMATSLNNIGYVYKNQGDVSKAKIFYYKALALQEEIDDKKGMATSLNNIAVIYDKQGDIAKALMYHHRALKIREEIDDKIGVATSLNNIGSIYEKQGNSSKALEYCFQSLEMEEEIGNKKGIASSLNNLGVLYYRRGDFDNALLYYHKALKIREEISDKKGIAYSLNNIGDSYYKQNNSELALDNYYRALSIREQIGDKKGTSLSLNSIGGIYYNQGKYVKANEVLQRSLSLSEELGYPQNIREACRLLSKVNKALGNYKEALLYFETFKLMADSIYNMEINKATAKQQLKYQYEKKAAADSTRVAEARKVTEARLLAQDEQIKKEKTQRFALYGGLLLLVVFGGFMYARFRVTKRQKNIIEQQKELVDVKNKEVKASINYAKRLQEAILPSRESLTKNLKNGFILYKPKDVVSGDFYFMDIVEKNQSASSDSGKKLVYYVVADCTGHGVPGAMVSIVGANGLKRCIQEFKLRDPGEILDRLSMLVAENFSQSEERIRDGMDIALCCVETNGDKNKIKVYYSGANNSLWIINSNRESVPENSLEFKTGGGYEIKPNKQSIGYTEDAQAYKTHTIHLEKGDTLYTFTDGYADQFGGDKGKKFKSANLKKLLVNIQEKSMDEQKNILDETFEKWKGQKEQIDDVCIIGVRF